MSTNHIFGQQQKKCGTDQGVRTTVSTWIIMARRNVHWIKQCLLKNLLHVRTNSYSHWTKEIRIRRSGGMTCQKLWERKINQSVVMQARRSGLEL